MKEIVIKIPDVIAETENEINIVLKDIQGECRAEYVDGAFHELFECSVLPKGHGRLIDADELYLDIQTDEEMRLGEHLGWVKDRFDNAPTIIEADKESEG